MMRVGLDTAPLHRPHTGIAVYSGQLIQAMLPLLLAGEALEYFSVMRFGEVSAEYIASLFVQNDGRGQDRRASPWTCEGLLLFLEKRLRQWPTLRGPLRMLRRLRFEQGTRWGPARRWDLFHALVSVPPGRIDAPVIPLLHDLSTRRCPEHHPAERVRMVDQWLPELVKAPVINTVSFFSRDEIVAELGVPKERVVVTYPGVDGFFLETADQDDQAALAALEVMPGGYFLAVATREPRKNLTTLISAYTELPEAVQARMPLLLAGGAGWGDLHLPAATQRLVDAGRVRFTGYVTRTALRALYRHTALFLFPSVYEGFGIPTVEALACGAPVAVTRGSSMHEILGDAPDAYGLTVEALDVTGWRRVMEDAAQTPAPTEEQRHARREHARSFDWGRTADITLQMYRDVLAGKRP